MLIGQLTLAAPRLTDLRGLESGTPRVALHRQNSSAMNATYQNDAPSQALEPLLDEREAARFLVVAAGTLGNWRRASPPVGPAYVVVEGVIRYAPDDLRDYVNSKRCDPRAAASA